jgi:hypothetical protein
MGADVEAGTPQAAAIAWVGAVLDRRDLPGAWARTDPVLRLVLAQDWVWNHRHDPAVGHDADWDAIARGLAADPPDHPLWERFEDELLSTWQRTWRGFGGSGWEVVDKPEVLDLDLEMVTFLNQEDGIARRFAMRHTPGGWLVAGVNGDRLFEPGWPPRVGGTGRGAPGSPS